MRIRLALLLATLALAASSPVRAADTAATPAANGPQAASRIRFDVAIVYPVAPAVEPIDVLRRELAADAQMPHLATAISDAETTPVVSVDWSAASKREGELPSADLLKYFARGLTPAQVEAFTHADRVLSLTFAHPIRDRMSALRNSQVLVERVARDTGGLIWDEESREAFTPDAWHQKRVLGWAGDVPDVAHHTVIHMYADDDGYRFVTLGMAKFGEPDIVIEDAVASDARGLGNLVNALSQALVEGALTDAQGQLTLRLQQSRHPAVDQLQGVNLRHNAERAARLLLVQGRREDGDADNRLVRIAFDRYDGPDEHARQAALASALYGSEDGVTRVRHDTRLLAARDAARANLPQLRETFNRGLAPGEYIDVKAPFATDGGGHEWMWVEVRAWKGDHIEGTLQNTPDDVKHLRVGQDVVVSEAELFDYIFHRADGRVEGNTTGAIIEEAAGAAK
jgi:uncharacterized protein YegJ (DUF2314 family)